MRRFVSPCRAVPVAFAPVRTHSARLALVLLILLATATLPAQARGPATIPPDGVVSGPARIVDGDTIDIAGTRIRLEGIDAPEAGQTCTNARGETWDCGNAATRELISLTHTRVVDCAGRGLDKYGRLLAVCSVGSLELNAEMVRRGYAWAFVRYSTAYVADEAVARAARAGIWQGPAQPAWEYRAARWTFNTQQTLAGCPIKGNVSRAGLIYHLPSSPWYAKVAMDESKGKRWFCTESEAIHAGWRPAMAH